MSDLLLPDGTLDLKAIAALDHSDPGAIERAERVLVRGTLRVGDYYWNGDECLVVTEVDANHSQKSSIVVRASHFHVINPSKEGKWLWLCPECGCGVEYPSDHIPLRLDPRCPDCQCPETMRDPTLPPAVPGLSDAAAGGADSGEKP